jgi:predicted ester cyclase
MTIEENNKALVTKIIQEYWHSWPGLQALAAYIAPGYVHHAAIGDFDFDGFKRGLGAFIDAFADARHTVTHLIAEGDLVAAHVKLTATHTGPFGPVAPTGRVLNMTGMYHCHIVQGKLVEDWDSWTALPLHRQTIAMLQS